MANTMRSRLLDARISLPVDRTTRVGGPIALFVLAALSLLGAASYEALFGALMAFQEMNSHGVLTIDHRHFVIHPRKVDIFFAELMQVIEQVGNLPLFGHSPAYHRLNRPSYVVVDLAPLQRSPFAFLLDHPIG